MPADIIDLFRELGLAVVKKTSGEWCSPCPACGGKDRCNIWPAEQDGRGYYWCRQCDVKGDGIQLLRDFAHMSFADACKRVGVAPAANTKAPSLPSTKQADTFLRTSADMGQTEDVDRATWQVHAAKLVAWGMNCLLHTPERLADLAKRGLDAAAVRRYHLGFNPGERGKNCIIRDRKGWGLQPVTKKDGTPKRLWLPRGFIVPQITYGPDDSWIVERVRIRRLDADREQFRPEHKYHVVEGSNMDLLWLPCTARIDTGIVVVQETELDTYMLHALAGDMANFCASMTSNIRKIGSVIFDNLQKAKCILVALDFDKAGAEGWHRWQATFPRAKRWPVPAGKDAGEAFSAGVDLRLWLMAGIPEGLRPSMPAGHALEMGVQTEAYREECAEPATPADVHASRPRRGVRPRRGISNGLYRPVGPMNALVILHDLGVGIAPDGDDFRYTGIEKWPTEDLVKLFNWTHCYGDWILMALNPQERA